MVVDTIPPMGARKVPMRSFGITNLREDFARLREGSLDIRSLVEGYRPHGNSVEVVVRDRAGKIKCIRRSHNLRTTMGRDNVQRLQMFGDLTAAASSYPGVFGTATSAPTSTSLTNSAATFPVVAGLNNGLQGHVVFCPAAGVYGNILSSTSHVLTVDQWTDATSAVGAVGTTPANGALYFICPGGSIAQWMGISTDTTTPVAGDVLRTADGLFATGGTTGTATEQAAAGLSRAMVQPTFPSAGAIQLQNTWTYTGSSLVTIGKVVQCNSAPGAGSLLLLESLVSPTAPVNSSGDTITITWTVNL